MCFLYICLGMLMYLIYNARVFMCCCFCVGGEGVGVGGGVGVVTCIHVPF